MIAVPGCVGVRVLLGHGSLHAKTERVSDKQMVVTLCSNACWGRDGKRPVSFHSVQPGYIPSLTCSWEATWLLLLNGCHVSRSEAEARASLPSPLLLPGWWHPRQPWKCQVLKMAEPLLTWVSDWLHMANTPPSHLATLAVGLYISRTQASIVLSQWGFMVPALVLS